MLINIYVYYIKKKWYCCFVDYCKAFDSVPIIHLWYKWLANGINGKILNVVKGLYGTAKSAIKQNSSHSTFFNCDIGVRQGDNLSPLLFALYLNDLQEHLSKAYNGLSLAYDLTQNWIQDAIQLYIIWNYLLSCTPMIRLYLVIINMNYRLH